MGCAMQGSSVCARSDEFNVGLTTSCMFAAQPCLIRQEIARRHLYVIACRSGRPVNA
jgi:hypothetical protein